MRYAVIHKDWGIFLGVDDIGIGWFAIANSRGLSVATTFTDDDSVDVFFKARFPSIPTEDLARVEIDTGDRTYATVMELAKAGIEQRAFGDMLAYVTPQGKA